MKYAPPIGQEAQGEEAHYVDGNPELGILGSPVPAAAIEQGQRELLHVIKQAGLTPSSEDLTQLFQAIGKLISDKVPIATNETVGLVKGGANIDIGEDGTISLTGIDPWSVFPKRVPIAVDGVTFGGSDGRRAIMPGESEPRENWVKCDGGSDGQGGSVPNLQGRFILGASEDHKAGSTGGSETHAHSLTGTVGDTTLSVEQIASHKHTLGVPAATGGGGRGIFLHARRRRLLSIDAKYRWLSVPYAHTGRRVRRGQRPASVLRPFVHHTDFLIRRLT